jgi:hypothetical protein
LPPAQFLWREFRDALLWQWNVDQRREQRRVFGWVQTDQTQSVLEVGETQCGGKIRVETVAAPFSDRV